MSQNQENINQNQEINSSSTSSIYELFPRSQEIKYPQKDSKIKMKSIPAKTLQKAIYKSQINNNFGQSIQSIGKLSNSGVINSNQVDIILKQSKVSVKQDQSQNQRQKKSISFDFSSQKKKNQEQLQKKQIVSSDSSEQKQEQIKNYIKKIKILKAEQKMVNSQEKMVISQEKNIRNQNVNTIKNKSQIQIQKNAMVKIQKQTKDINHLLKELQAKNKKIDELQRIIDTQTELNQIQKKANQVYTQFHHDIVKLLNSSNQKSKQSQWSMEKILKSISQMIEVQKQANRANNFQKKHENQYENQKNIKIKYETRLQQLNLIINNCDDKISQLRNELVKSTQNNINAIFNTEISASSCLQQQIYKINRQLSSLKMNINEVSYQSKQGLSNLVRIQPEIYKQKQPQVIKIYNNFGKPQDNIQDSKIMKQKNKRKNKKQMQQISSQLQNQSNQQKLNKKTIEQIKNSYFQIKQQYSNLFKALKILSQDQQTHKRQLQRFNTKLLNTIKLQFQQQNKKHQRQIALKYQQERLSDKNLINHLNNKFVELIQAISIPQKIKRQVGDETERISFSEISLSVQYIRQMQRLKNINTQLYQQINQLQKENNYLKNELAQINFPSRTQLKKRKQSFIFQLKDLTSKQLNSQNNLNQNQYQNNIQKYSNPDLVDQQMPIVNNTCTSYQVNPNIHNFNQINPNMHSTYPINSHMQSYYPINPHMHSTNQIHPNIESSYKNAFIYNNQINQQQLTQKHKNNYKMVLKDKNDKIKLLTQQLFQQNKIIRQKQSKIHQLQILFQNYCNRNPPVNFQNFTNNIQNPHTNQYIRRKNQQKNINQQNTFQNQQNINNYQIIRDNYENHANNIRSVIQFDESNSIIGSNLQNTQQRYEIKIKNLKLLLKDVRRQNNNLKLQLHELYNQQGAECRTETINIMKSSVTHSDRTAKNYPSNNNSPNIKKGGQIFIKRRMQQNRIDGPIQFQHENIRLNQEFILLCLKTISQILEQTSINNKQQIKIKIKFLLKNIEQKYAFIWQNIYNNISIRNLIDFLAQVQTNVNKVNK